MENEQDWEQRQQQQGQRIPFNQLSSWSKVAVIVHIFAYDSRRPPGFTTTVAIDSNLLGIDFHSQPVVLPAVEIFGEVRLGECFDAFVCGLMPRLHPAAARTSPPGCARPLAPGRLAPQNRVLRSLKNGERSASTGRGGRSIRSRFHVNGTSLGQP
jgi:hypothetical protein